MVSEGGMRVFTLCLGLAVHVLQGKIVVSTILQVEIFCALSPRVFSGLEK